MQQQPATPKDRAPALTPLPTTAAQHQIAPSSPMLAQPPLPILAPTQTLAHSPAHSSASRSQRRGSSRAPPRPPCALHPALLRPAAKPLDPLAPMPTAHHDPLLPASTATKQTPAQQCGPRPGYEPSQAQTAAPQPHPSPTVVMRPAPLAKPMPGMHDLPPRALQHRAASAEQRLDPRSLSSCCRAPFAEPLCAPRRVVLYAARAPSTPPQTASATQQRPAFPQAQSEARTIAPHLAAPSVARAPSTHPQTASAMLRRPALLQAHPGAPQSSHCMLPPQFHAGFVREPIPQLQPAPSVIHALSMLNSSVQVWPQLVGFLQAQPQELSPGLSQPVLFQAPDFSMLILSAGAKLPLARLRQFWPRA